MNKLKTTLATFATATTAMMIAGTPQKINAQSSISMDLRGDILSSQIFGIETDSGVASLRLSFNPAATDQVGNDDTFVSCMAINGGIFTLGENTLTFGSGCITLDNEFQGQNSEQFAINFREDNVISSTLPRFISMQVLFENPVGSTFSSDSLRDGLHALNGQNNISFDLVLAGPGNRPLQAHGTFNATVQPIPEPATIALMAVGGGALVFNAMRRRKNTNLRASTNEPNAPELGG